MAAAFHTQAARTSSKKPPHIVSMSADGSTPSSAPATAGPLETLCKATLDACESLTPTISSLYHSINSSESKKGAKSKADNSAFTIADGLVQHLLVEELLGGVVGSIVGEEECGVNLNKEPYTVDDLEIPSEFVGMIQEAKSQLKNIRKQCLCESAQEDTYRSLTAFLDPIDGTREFSTGKGEQCSICVGFSDASGMPLAGVVYRPIASSTPTWAAGAKSEGYADSNLSMASADERDCAGLLTTNGSISPFIGQLIKELNSPRTPSGGAGNKMLMLLERKGRAYIQDRGVSRWDTAAAQAVIEAHGGVLCKLSTLLTDKGKEESYTYLKSETNLDFAAGEANLTAFNAAVGAGEIGKTRRIAMNASEVKPYANLCGLFAIGPDENTEAHKSDLLAAIQRASEFSPPSFD
jgi:3'-phosphoadenosine 5'-phosphosulfate (PAPS) 3'-phosphatase